MSEPIEESVTAAEADPTVAEGAASDGVGTGEAAPESGERNADGPDEALSPDDEVDVGLGPNG